MALSAALLMIVQPMFAKMVLPRLGGTPAVWNTCVVFFQVTLLAGYAYAHLSVRWLGVRRQAWVHLGVLALPLLVLPIHLDATRQMAPGASPIAFLLLLLTTGVGLPFLAVSMSAPLLQRWFASTDHAHAHDPYFLYAASNAGSLLSLMAYPVLIEPRLRVQDQSRYWAIGYGLLLACMAACAWRLWRSMAAAPATSSPAAGLDGDADVARDRVTWPARLLWVALAAVPSSLMLSVTTFISTDIGAVPLLWVVPLALYLLSFVMAFARRPLVPVGWLNTLLPLVVMGIATAMVVRRVPPLGAIPIHLAGFFIVALFCHGRLAASRPSATHLTEFYLWMSLGGAVGGLFNTFVAPVIFIAAAEYPLGLVAAALLRMAPAPARPDSPAEAPAAHLGESWRSAVLHSVVPAAIVAGVTWAFLAVADRSASPEAEWTVFGIRYAIPFALALACYRRPVQFGLAFGAILLVAQIHSWAQSPTVHAERTFFGLHVVTDRGDFRYLTNGTTSHGSQAHDVGLRCEPTTYYSRTGPIGQLFGTFVGPHTRRRIGSVGLGTGTMASYAQPGQQWTFFEINPAIKRIAEGGEYFTYLRECISRYDIAIGDARVSLSRAPDASFDVLVLDAFTSDAIPVHLITREAIALYFRKLAPDGVLAVHISNRYLDLEPVIGAIANGEGLAARIEHDLTTVGDQREFDKASSVWVVLARTPEDLADLDRDPRWSALDVPADAPLWTDDFSNLFRILRW